MKKLILLFCIFFLFLGLFTLPTDTVALNSEIELEEPSSWSHTSGPLPKKDFLENERSYPNTWYQPFYNIAGGAVLLGCSYFIPDERVESLAVAFGAGIICNNVLKVFGDVFECFWNTVESVNIRKEIDKSKNLRKDPKRQEKFTTERIEKSSKYARTMIRQSLNLTNLSMKLMVLYNGFQDGTFTDPNTRNHNFMFMSLIGAGAINNLNEIIYCWRTGEGRKNIPFFEIFDGVYEVTLGRQLFNSWSIQNLELAPGIIFQISRNLTNTESIIYRSFLAHGDCQVLNGIFQMSLNALDYIRKLRKKKITVEEMLAENSLTKNNRPLLNPSNTTSSSSNQPSADFESFRKGEDEENSEAQDKIKLKEKKKTRGTGTEPAKRMVASKKEQNAQSIEAPTDTEKNRKEALNHLQSFRKKDTLKKREVDSELAMLCRLLPNASLEVAGHNKKAIILQFENRRKFRIVYEEPHQQRNAGADEYKGFRKDRVLDALQVAYLYGWNEEEIKNFLRHNNIVRFYNLPEFLIHILWTRGQ